MTATIYRIVCEPTGDCYIGSTAGPVPLRWASHIHLLNCGRHPSKAFQDAWKRFGFDSFQFESLQRCSDLERRSLEQEFIERLHPTFNVRSALRIVRPRTKQGTATRGPMTFKIEPEYRHLIEAVARTTNRTPSEFIRDLVLSYFRGTSSSDGSSDSEVKVKAS